MTKQQRLLKLLKRYPKSGVTTMMIITTCRTSSPHDLVHQLIKKGYEITCELTRGRDGFGDKCTYGIYRLR